MTTDEQTRALIGEIRKQGLSIRAISERTGIPRSTVADHIAALGDDKPKRITGRDGRGYPAVWAPVAEERREPVALRDSGVDSTFAHTLLLHNLRQARQLAVDASKFSAAERAQIARDLRVIARRCGCPPHRP